VSGSPVKVGVLVPTFRDDPSAAISIALEAESLGIDGVFAYDHLWPMGHPGRPALAPFPLLGAIAASSTRLWVGTLVARVGVVPDEILVAEFAALARLAPGRVIAGLGTGDHLSANENRAYGLAFAPPDERRRAVEHCARLLLDMGLTVWVGGLARPTVAVAERTGAAANFWQASPERVADQAGRSEVTWAGMGRPDGGSGELDAGELIDVGRPLVEAGASWVVLGWPTRLHELAAAAETLRAS
jgi:alkanesulfonate monooxygenase SsuD/methylene tetrahydromethanopterin reductase-like flavin-dependent oxidoreductase (luciferase family)